MKTNHLATPSTIPTKPHWIQQLWQLVRTPAGNSPITTRDNTPKQPFLEDTKNNTRSPELAPPQALINDRTIEAFSDYADEYEPIELALADLIPDELALLNTSPAQLKASEHKQATTQQTEPSYNSALIDIANATPATKELSGDKEGDEEYLLQDFIPPELSELSQAAEEQHSKLSAA